MPSRSKVDGSPLRGSGMSRKKLIWIWAGVVFAVCAIAAIVVAVLFKTNVIHTGSSNGSTSGQAVNSGSPAVTSSGGGGGGGNGATATGTASPAASTVAPVACSASSDIPKEVQGTYLDPTTWYDMTDFNCTYTSETVGGLPLLGLNSTWDDSTQANKNVPALNKPWSYGTLPIRGVNLGGWLSLEPFITPSLFTGSKGLIVDEWNLVTQLGPKQAAATLEKHYATFITEADFAAIAAAGLDHVRIPYSYWAVAVYDADPYVLGISFRYLLRGIEWARKHGLRVNLDLHAVPGSQNGWNHSGRSGTVNWLMGTNGTLNAQRSLDIHDKLSKFFAQPRYANVVAFYGLVNEPSYQLTIPVLANWTLQAYEIVRTNGVKAPQIFSEAFKGLGSWQGQMQGYKDTLVIDAHEYVIFAEGTIAYKHDAKVKFACDTFSSQVSSSESTSTGFGPTMVGEWSQADTDCALYLNGVGMGARWNGSFVDTGGKPFCPTGDKTCDCPTANADPSTYTDDYKTFLKVWAEAQMAAYEKGWGWFYWTWKTENAPLWSYSAALAAGIMPAQAYAPDWDCSKTQPSYGSLPETY